MNILLHICCANCAIYPLEVLRARNLRVHGYFFNHNIHPYQEYSRRLQAVRHWAAATNLDVTYRDEYRLEEFLAQVAAAPEKRCDYCYRSRLEETARAAAEQGFAAFSTSLLYSRYQQHDHLRELGEQVGRRHGVKFHYDDFRVGWQQGIQASKALGLYRQQYCGCIYSEKDRYHPRVGS
ncbi:epoxyqueuosine reductase QueH [Geoalkalibacter halelectricus]|uniref:Epoxyqueuosine reductase QueH n=1 Tax=Geoalkalibacter halelectricus TaxID=2847045 RepID=A0ABY5ZQ53_9BACT|nr:epoxyqueuosine reductase QueH [Geoalkalibacter halelectricus]MDO3379206.1 epoxyqueuosine reductase QueH [Geoalkalibacter halelectricus]UWZ80964.1 epoxyqueuosine reductase QueH [Geoalkalibacter halelectricus]